MLLKDEFKPKYEELKLARDQQLISEEEFKREMQQLIE